MDDSGAPPHDAMRQFSIEGALAKIDAAGNRPARLLQVAIRALAEARDQVRPEAKPGPDEFRHFIYQLTTAYFAVGQILGVERDVILESFGVGPPYRNGVTARPAQDSEAAPASGAGDATNV
jgi:hypothetical protein